MVHLQLYTKDHQVMPDMDGGDIISKFESVDVSSKRYSIDLFQYPQWHYYEVLSHAIVDSIMHDGIL